MNNKTLLAILIGFVVIFLLGWITYDMILGDYMANNSLPGMSKPEEEVNILWIVIGSLSWVVMLTFVLDKMGAQTVKQGAMNSFWIALLIALSYDSYFWAATNFFTSMEVICVDILVSAITGTIVGGVIGWMLGMNNKSASTS